MKVQELIDLLLTFGGDAEVIMQKDAEGNGYSPLEGVDGECVYVPDSSYSGTVYATTWSAKDADMDEGDWEDFRQRPRCVVLYPVN